MGVLVSESERNKKKGILACIGEFVAQLSHMPVFLDSSLLLLYWPSTRLGIVWRHGNGACYFHMSHLVVTLGDVSLPAWLQLAAFRECVLSKDRGERRSPIQ